MNNNLEFRVLQLVSGHYLCANYPDNWYELSDSKQLEFIQDNLWEPVENESPNLIRGAIESAAQVTLHFIEDLNK